MKKTIQLRDIMSFDELKSISDSIITILQRMRRKDERMEEVCGSVEYLETQRISEEHREEFENDHEDWELPCPEGFEKPMKLLYKALVAFLKTIVKIF